MGSSQSVQVDEEEDEDEEEEEEEGDHNVDGTDIRRGLDNHSEKKVLEQEPEMLPCHASASPLSPQLSALGTPRLGPSIKVWDPYNVLAPPPPPPPPPRFSRSFSLDTLDDDRTVTEVFLISHGECEMSLRPDLVAGRCPETALTSNGKRQARALAVFLNSQGVRFNAVYSSPLDRARATAVSVCQEMNFVEEQIQTSDALVDMSQGHWEGCPRSEIYTPETLNLIDRFQPDFSAPSGESLRQVEFRVVQFLNGTLLGLPDKLRADFHPLHQSASQVFSHNPHALANSVHDRDGTCLPHPHWDLLHRTRQGLSRKKSGKSRLQFVTTTGDHEAEDEISPREVSNRSSLHEMSSRSSSSCVSSIGVFTHSVPITCLITGLLGCSPVMSNKICIEDSSVTVLQHAWKTGWQVKRLNDTAHLRLL
ncbi:uncharacterized protein LOC131167736 [Malania oleifera]|uniref:uncharacterized protein LOC131167736 n=1 Tax=Malania oleifera TaxID=397392 RepID=UPI0025ADD635|nr:uncharacterized protein LOC131167736 [Malania oleifera]XP_057982589.1 uncharacterized protein LOC131167736 [Malania oleifera]